MKKKQIDKIRKDRLEKNKGSKVKKPKKSLRAKRSKSTVGDIHFVHPTHLIDKKNIEKYKNEKGNFNLRPVAIVKENKKNEVSIAQIYGKKGKSKDYPRVSIPTTKLPKKSHIDIAEQDKSLKTGNRFKTNESPLNRKRKGKVTQRDLKKRDQAIKQKKPPK